MSYELLYYLFGRMAQTEADHEEVIHECVSVMAIQYSIEIIRINETYYYVKIILCKD
jgi:hypothetical protein